MISSGQLTAVAFLPKAILFDWDNTLVDTWPCLLKAMNLTLIHMGHAPWTETEARVRISRSLRDSFPDLFAERWQEASDVFYASFKSSHLDMLAPLPGAEVLVRSLCDAGIWTGIVSNKTGDLLRMEVEHLGWSRMFNRIAGAGDAVSDKPDPAHVLLALQGSGLTPGQDDIWLVGDHAVDMQCAAAAGCSAFLLHRDPSLAGDFSRWPPQGIFENCVEFLDALRTLPVPSNGNRW